MLKVSGEALAGPEGFGIDNTVVQAVAKEVAIAVLSGVQVQPRLITHAGFLNLLVMEAGVDYVLPRRP